MKYTAARKQFKAEGKYEITPSPLEGAGWRPVTGYCKLNYELLRQHVYTFLQRFFPARNGTMKGLLQFGGI